MAGGRKRDWIRKKMTAAAGGGSLLRVRALTTALRRQRRRLPRVHLLRLLYESVVFRLLWVIESLVVLARLCFFFLRFGFRL
ncbi:hypothetical protein D1007_61202 [Hordeum vulgare]|uniref:uncharacterized protein LOC123420737 n=1 Tax=Hordeum vulgare subsp. vulgare TaxID=112509 RepID=UPI001D1A3689|nr:uncharacterized protein LOC123420737 [Hordeum vulgare subsp. vulgare]KAE8767435.1 hypothetical protein D1007_61202 [Hordeum vulgare]